MKRERPTFKAKRELRKLTKAEEQECRDLRARGWSLNRIMLKLHTYFGRVSEAVNGKKKKPRG
jgi:hypothetical protein